MGVIDGSRVEQIITDERIDLQEKFEALWQYYYPRLLVYTGSFKGLQNVDPKDMVSDILFKVLSSLHTYKRIYSLSTWVYNIAKNHAIDAYRKNKNSAGTISLDKIAEQDMVDRRENNSIIDKVIENDSIEKCRICIKSLDKKDQRLIFLKYYEGLNAKEIALIEGVSHNTVRQRLMTVRRRLKKLLGEDYEN
ncbi:MAG: sigma-70 family RNA polymerase sigma factor [Treponema sp.]|jgi:RNA polymerase sigma-70 factor (ECF subfamily)|nr:sigma-70 family RNA polymerase sigma factor [Treponema sp.]